MSSKVPALGCEGVRSLERPTQTVLLTGAATGVGLAAAEALSQAGYRVLATAMPGQASTELGTIVNVEILEVDLTDKESLAGLVERVQMEPRLDAFISNAGLAVPGPIECLPLEQVQRQYAVNVFAPLRLVQALLPQLRESRGRVIFIGAGQGRVSLPFGGAYGSSKAALAAVADSLRAEVHASGIRVSMVEPGAVKTDILAKSQASWAELSARLPQDLRERYGPGMAKTFQASEKAFKNALEPQELAQILVKILQSKKPKPRYLIGREARLLAVLALLPARWRTRLLLRLLE